MRINRDTVVKGHQRPEKRPDGCDVFPKEGELR